MVIHIYYFVCLWEIITAKIIIIKNENFDKCIMNDRLLIQQNVK